MPYGIASAGASDAAIFLPNFNIQEQKELRDMLIEQ
jgi:hypothetical protein